MDGSTAVKISEDHALSARTEGRDMLNKVRVQGFKAIVDTGPLILPSISVFLGRNGSGKSSFLESLQWLQECFWGGIQAATRSRFVSFEDLINRRTQSIVLDLEFASLSYHLEVGQAGANDAYGVLSETCTVRQARARRKAISTGAKYRRQIAGGSAVEDRDTLALSRLSETRAKGTSDILDFLRRAVFLRLSPAAMGGPGLVTLPAQGPLLDEKGSNLPALLLSLKPPQRKQVLKQLQEALEISAHIEKVAVNENNLTQSGTIALEEKMQGPDGIRGYKLPAWVLSEGTRRIAAIYALLAMDPPPSLIAIEEVENGLDPWTLNLVLNALQSASANGIQVVLTTHSPYFLDQFDADQIFHVSRQEGNSRYRRIVEYPEVAEYEGIVPPGVMYLSEYFPDGTKKRS